MRACAVAAILAWSCAVSFGCETPRQIGRDCPVSGCAEPKAYASERCGELAMPNATVAAGGGDLARCQLFTLDGVRVAAGDDRAYLTEALAEMIPYDHEIDLRITPEISGVADGPIDCNDILDRPLPWVPLVESLGGRAYWSLEAPLPSAASPRLLVRERFTNMSNVPVAVGVSMQFMCAPSRIDDPSQTFEFVDTAPHSVVSGQPLTVSGRCSFDHEVNVWTLFRASPRIGSLIVWSGDPVHPIWSSGSEWSTDLSPVVDVKVGTDVTWECVYENQSDMSSSFEIGGDSPYVCGLKGLYQRVHGGQDVPPAHCTLEE
jgi:hypothetical protein